MTDAARLEARLDSFDAAERRQALRELAAGRRMRPSAGGNVNMHFHSFLSYNAEGWSPSHIAWAASQRALYAAGMCDFDVLDGLEEFLAAGRLLGLRAAVYLETRAFAPALAAVEINSPGEPGVAYAMGAGFGRAPRAGTPEAETLAGLRRTARDRNLALLGRMSAAVPDIRIDYERDVLPLTPAGVATERHIIKAWTDMVTGGRDPEPRALLGRLLDKDGAALERLLSDRVALEEALRSKLVKRGGVAYAQPDATWFPPLEDFFAWVSRCGAIPMAAWLDGTSGGEIDADAFLDAMAAAGASALNVIPDRNWNYRDPAERERKATKLREVVAAAVRRHMPVNIGTEMNRAGLPFVDDLEGPVLREPASALQAGARVMVGQSILCRYAGVSFTGDSGQAEIGAEPASRGGFFAAVGRLPPLTEDVAKRLEDAGEMRALTAIREAVKSGRWAA
jgi:hypothetical protein